MPLQLLPSADLLKALVQPLVGIVGNVASIPHRSRGLVYLPGVTCETGALGVLYPAQGGLRSFGWVDERSSGTAVDLSPARANTRALGEALERYATSIVLPDEYIIASARELGSGTFDPETIPRCSEEEYSDPACPLRKFDSDAPIRWIKGVSLTSGETTLIPLVMSHHHIRSWDVERFWLPISTGVAAHTDLATALVSGLMEVIERDAIALTWLLRRPLPRIELDEDLLDAELLAKLVFADGEFLIHDATTDLGVPIGYGLQRRREHPTLHSLVACAAGHDWSSVCTKVLFELAQLNLVNWPSHDLPEDPKDFMRLEDGAVYMAAAERTHCFDFLGTSARVTRPEVNEAVAGVSVSPEQQLAALVARLKTLGHDVFAVDLTTDDLGAVGLNVVRVVVPTLMPMSPVMRARYLGHARLRDFAERTLGTPFDPRSINPTPQPFA